MLQVRAYVPGDAVEEVSGALERLVGVNRVVRAGTSTNGDELLTVDVEPDAADSALELLASRVSDDDVSLLRLDTAGPVDHAPREAWVAHDPETLAWAEVVDEARESAQLLGRYLVLMFAAGVIAAVGVVDANVIPVIGAMAVSPDLLPLAAACVGLVSRRPRIVARALGSLVIGLALASLAAAGTALVLDAFGVFSGDLGAGGLRGLTSTDAATIVIALAAGIAAMLTFETRAGSAVGVAISVTTIPAAAYLGVAIATKGGEKALDAFGVLVTNQVCVVVAGTITLLLHRWLRARLPGRR
jgi:uncharacterized hydrophobic protein (TIGR00271 family)